MEIKELHEIYSENIKKFRTKKGLKQDVLAEKVDLSEKYISDLETGRRIGSFETLVSLANALEVEPYELLLPPQTAISYDTKKTKDLMNRLRKNLGDVVDTLENFLKKSNYLSKSKTRYILKEKEAPKFIWSSPHLFSKSCQKMGSNHFWRLYFFTLYLSFSGKRAML